MQRIKVLKPNWNRDSLKSNSIQNFRIKGSCLLNEIVDSKEPIFSKTKLINMKDGDLNLSKIPMDAVFLLSRMTRFEEGTFLRATLIRMKKAELKSIKHPNQQNSLIKDEEEIEEEHSSKSSRSQLWDFSIIKAGRCLSDAVIFWTKLIYDENLALYLSITPKQSRYLKTQRRHIYLTPNQSTMKT